VAEKLGLGNTLAWEMEVSDDLLSTVIKLYINADHTGGM
jgi:hypothetical protein